MKNNAAGILPQQWILGEIYQETKKCFIMSVFDRSEKTLLPIIQKYNIRPVSTIIKNCWKAYNNLQQAGSRFKIIYYNNIILNRERDSNIIGTEVKHNYHFVDPDTGLYAIHSKYQKIVICRVLLNDVVLKIYYLFIYY